MSVISSSLAYLMLLSTILLTFIRLKEYNQQAFSIFHIKLLWAFVGFFFNIVF